MLRPAAALCIAAAVVTSSRAMYTQTVLSFGDSWAYGNGNGLRTVLHRRGRPDIQVKIMSDFGSTAAEFASDARRTSLADAVDQTRADVVVLSLGGNDLKNFYFRGDYVMPWTASLRIEKSLTTVLDELYSRHPNAKVAMYGYDFLGAADDYLFRSGEKSVFRRKLYRWVAVPLSNFVASYLSTALKNVERRYQRQGRSFTYVPLWGTLQEVLDKEEQRDRRKSFSYWKHSADEYMQDPIHANAKGYAVLMGRLCDEYLDRQLGIVAPPTSAVDEAVAAAPSPAAVSDGGRGARRSAGLLRTSSLSSSSSRSSSKSDTDGARVAASVAS